MKNCVVRKVIIDKHSSKSRAVEPLALPKRNYENKVILTLFAKLCDLYL